MTNTQRPRKICTARPQQYLRGGAQAIIDHHVVVAPHASGRRLDKIIGWMHVYGAQAAPAKVTPSRNKREGNAFIKRKGKYARGYTYNHSHVNWLYGEQYLNCP